MQPACSASSACQQLPASPYFAATSAAIAGSISAEQPAQRAHTAGISLSPVVAPVPVSLAPLSLVCPGPGQPASRQTSPIAR